MPTSRKIVIGAAVTFLGLAGLFYIMPIVTNAVASDGPVFKEEDVHKLPDSMKMYVPLEIGAAGAIMVGIAFMGVGLKILYLQKKMMSLEQKKKKAQQQTGTKNQKLQEQPDKAFQRTIRRKSRLDPARKMVQERE